MTMIYAVGLIFSKNLPNLPNLPNSGNKEILEKWTFASEGKVNIITHE